MMKSINSSKYIFPIQTPCSDSDTTSISNIKILFYLFLCFLFFFFAFYREKASSSVYLDLQTLIFLCSKQPCDQLVAAFQFSNFW